jgi:hypothetical protein
MASRVEVLDAPSAISWKPGYDAGAGSPGFGGWIWRAAGSGGGLDLAGGWIWRGAGSGGRLDLAGGWIGRYDLTPAEPSETEVALSYDWSAAPDLLRRRIGLLFVPFGPFGQLARPCGRTGGLLTGQASVSPGLAPPKMVRLPGPVLAMALWITLGPRRCRRSVAREVSPARPSVFG